MEDAVKIDPGFAMAYRTMSVAYDALGNAAKSTEYIKKAMELSDRLSERERDLIQLTYYTSSEKTYPQAFELGDRLLKLDPNDSFVNSYLETIYVNIEDWEKVVYHGEICRKEKSLHLGDYLNLAYAYEKLGRYDKAREAILAYIPFGGDSARIHAYVADNYLLEGTFDLALAEADKAIALNPTSYSKATIWFLQGDWERHEKECQRYLAMADESNHLGALYWLEISYRTQGRFKQALEQARLRYQLAKKRNSPEGIAYSQGAVGYNLFHLGELSQARLEAQAMLEFAEKNKLLVGSRKDIVNSFLMWPTVRTS
jgi:tetratricopeptide (TPR) repeat protein